MEEIKKKNRDDLFTPIVSPIIQYFYVFLRLSFCYIILFINFSCLFTCLSFNCDFYREPLHHVIYHGPQKSMTQILVSPKLMWTFPHHIKTKTRSNPRLFLFIHVVATRTIRPEPLRACLWEWESTEIVMTSLNVKGQETSKMIELVRVSTTINIFICAFGHH